LLLGIGCGLLLAAAPSAATAATVNVRIESTSGTLVPSTSVSLPSTPVAPASATPDQTCSGGSVAGAVSAATNNDWSGIWTDGSGWSINRIKNVDTTGSLSRKWAVLVNGAYLNDPPCTKLLTGGDTLMLYPICIAQSTSSCFPGGPLQLDAASQAGPNVFINVQVWQTDVTFVNGIGTAVRTPGTNATLISPSESAHTDQYYGFGSIRVADKGPATLTAGKGGYITDRHDVCITDGGDGYCGTEVPTPIPFDPLAYCTTTGNDGYCGSPDHVAPAGHITAPTQAQTFAGKSGPTLFKGTVDFDPSLTDHVSLRLMRQTTITVTTYKTRKVWVTKKVKGKRVRKRVKKRTAVRKKRTACYSWSDTASEFKRMARCDASTAPQFPAGGAETWQYEFLSRIPSGSYTLDALAVDGAKNVDSVMATGRNRVTFKVR
jgi:hypothetical protein